MKELTNRQKTFCQQLAAGTSGSAAARIAGYKNERVAASRLLKRDYIQQQIHNLCKEVVKDSKAKSGVLIDDLITIASQPSIATYLTQSTDGEIIWKDVSELTYEQLVAIKTTVPVKDIMQERWSSIELFDKAIAVSKLVEMMQPNLTRKQQEAIVKALTRLGRERGFTDAELDILVNSLSNAT